MNEQTDKLCKGSQRRERGEPGDTGADTVVFGMLNTQSAGTHCRAHADSVWMF